MMAGLCMRQKNLTMTSTAAILTVQEEEFWQGLRAVTFGNLPKLQDPVTVVGYASYFFMHA